MKTQLKLYSIVILCFLTLLNVKAADLPTSYLQVGGTTRSMLVHVPTNLQSNRPLVISLHGMGQDPNYQKGMANWEAVADTANFVVVYPQGVNNAWDISGDSDINFILAIIDEMNSKYAIDKSRVYVSGFSMGGMMTYHAANKIADKIAAFAPVSGFMCWGNATYNSSRAIPIIHVHGDADNVVYYDASGGQSGLAPIISGWVDRNNCSKNAIVTYPHSSAKKEVYSNGECDTEVVLVTLSGCGHWHSTSPFNSTIEIWNFIKNYTIECGKGSSEDKPSTGVAGRFGQTPPLHVDGKYLKDDCGNIVHLHGVMDTPNNYFNSGRWEYNWGLGYADYAVPNAIAYFKKIFSAITDTAQGAYCNLFRLHMDPAWTNDPNIPIVGEGGEHNISQFSLDRLKKYSRSLFFPIAKDAIDKGLYVILRPPGVCPFNLKVGDEYNQFLMTVWDEISKNDSILKYQDLISLELANEPIALFDANGNSSDKALYDYFQPIVNRIRANGFKGIIWIPGTGYQSGYQSYAKYPIDGDNIGYAVHVYPGWYGNDDDRGTAETFITNFKNQVPVVETNPIVVTECDWSPGKPKLDENGNYVYNYDGSIALESGGTWAMGSTSKWGNKFKAVMDHFGLSLTLTSTDDYVDMEIYLETGKSTPAFDGNPEACAKACWDWYADYSKDFIPQYCDDDYVCVGISSKNLELLINSQYKLTISALYDGGPSKSVTGKCTFTVADNSIISINNGTISALANGETSVIAKYTDDQGDEFTTEFTVEVSYFPLTNEGFDPNIWETGSFNEETKILVTGQYGFGGWQYNSAIDLSDYSQIIVKLQGKQNSQTTFRLFDESSYWSKPFSYVFENDETIAVINLSQCVKDDENQTPLNLSNIYIAGFWSLGGSEIPIESVTLVKRDTSSIDDVIDTNNAEIISAEYMNPLGVVKNTPHKGLNIVRYTYSDGNEVIIKILF